MSSSCHPMSGSPTPTHSPSVFAQPLRRLRFTIGRLRPRPRTFLLSLSPSLFFSLLFSSSYVYILISFPLVNFSLCLFSLCNHTTTIVFAAVLITQPIVFHSASSCFPISSYTLTQLLDSVPPLTSTSCSIRLSLLSKQLDSDHMHTLCFEMGMLSYGAPYRCYSAPNFSMHFCSWCAWLTCKRWAHSWSVTWSTFCPYPQSSKHEPLYYEKGVGYCQFILLYLFVSS